MIIGSAILYLYIANLFDRIQFSMIIQKSTEWIYGIFIMLKPYLPIVYVISALIVLIRMILVSYQMGKAKIEFPSIQKQQVLLPIDTDTSNDPHTDESVSTTTEEQPNTLEKENKLQIIREKHLSEQNLKRESILNAVLVYVEKTMAPFMKSEDIEILCSNIRIWQACSQETLSPTVTNGRLTTLDLRHLAWNIGERFKWTGEQRAMFIKQSFPYEFRDSDLPTIRRNLRQQGNCQIKLDVPKNDDNYEFNS